MLFKKLRGDSCFDRYLFCILIAIEILMSFTFFGYLHIPPISITIAYLPILVAGCLYEPTHSVTMAFLFGFASMYKASASYVMPADAVFSPFLSDAPASSLMLSVGTRVLFGFLIGILFQAVRKSRHYRLWTGLISAVAPKIHSLIVYTAMGLLFPELGKHYYSAFHWKMDDTVFALICVIVVETSWTVYQSNAIQHIRMCIDQSANNPYASQKMNLFFVAFELFLVGMSVFAAFYFSQRESYMLIQHGVAVSDTISSDLLLLQLQFLFASLALNIIMVILLISTYKYMSYKEYRVEIDALTGVMGRRLFLYYCGKALNAGGKGTECMGWFLFVDVDYFKAINDTFGHSTGDQVLRRIAQHLQRIFGEDGKVGRIGGDEFAVILEKPMTENVLGQRLEQFQKECSHTLPDRTVSCSIGAYQFMFPQNVEHLLEETDAVLYQAKENGRACYVMKPCL